VDEIVAHREISIEGLPVMRAQLDLGISLNANRADVTRGLKSAAGRPGQIRDDEEQ
jgi:hypothetical protein